MSFLARLKFTIVCVAGSEDGKIHVWNAESGMKVAVLDGKHTGPITCLQFNPKFMTFASACSNMVSKCCAITCFTLVRFVECRSDTGLFVPGRLEAKG